MAQSHQSFRPGKTKQDKMPVELRPRVAEANARVKLPNDQRKSLGATVKWGEPNGGTHVGRVTKDEGDVITVEYGSGNKHGERQLDRDEVEVIA